MAETKTTRARIRKVFREIIWPRRGALSLGFLLIVISRGASLVLPGASKFLLDDVVGNKDYDYLYFLLLIVFAAVFVQSLTSYLLTRILSIEAQRLIAKLRARVQQHVLSLPIRFFDNNKSGGLVSRVMTDVDGVRNLVGTGLVQMVGGLLTSIVTLIILLNINVMMTLICIVPVLIYAVAYVRLYRFIRPVFRKRRMIRAEVTGRLNESLGGIRVIKGFNAEKYEQNVFYEGVMRLFYNIRKTMNASALVSSLTSLLVGLASIAVMGFGGYFMIEGSMSQGEFLAFSMYLGLMVNPLIQLGNIGTQLTEALAGLDRTEELLNMHEENDPELRPIKMEEVKGHVSFEEVRFAYEEDTDVLHGISFEAPPGSVTALVGTSGSGKSTIASLVASFLHPYRGNITIDGKDMNRLDLESYRKQLGLVLQDDFLFEGSIRDNIIFANPQASEEALLDAVQAAYVNEFTDRFDKGLDTLIGERGVKLSGGQKQRIAIARAIIANPRILILDEATSNLDTESEMLIQRSLSELMKDRTTFVIAHRLSTIRKADQILVIEQGNIVERGTHEELVDKVGGRYHELHTYQARI